MRTLLARREQSLERTAVRRMAMAFGSVCVKLSVYGFASHVYDFSLEPVCFFVLRLCIRLYSLAYPGCRAACRVGVSTVLALGYVILEKILFRKLIIESIYRLQH